MLIKKEQDQDHQKVFTLIKAAFEKEEHTDHQEQYLVERLRKSTAFIPELSLVAYLADQLVGYVLLTRISITPSGVKPAKLLALAPLVVDPMHQRKGIGGALLKAAHKQAKVLGLDAIILLGHAAYYPKFGYQKSSKYGITLPFEVPEENCMLMELNPNALQGIQGVVQYPQEFFE